MCLHTMLTGHQSDSVRIDMQPLLSDTETPDEHLLECANEAERKNMKKCLASQSVTNVNVVQSEDTSPVTYPVKEIKAKVLPELLIELAELKTGVASLKVLSAELAPIKETLQQPMLNYNPNPSLQLCSHARATSHSTSIMARLPGSPPKTSPTAASVCSPALHRSTQLIFRGGALFASSLEPAEVAHTTV